MRILAIESSCDETAIAILEGNGKSLKLKKNAIYSQIDIHKQYGGVVPEVAARKHVETVIPLIDSTLGKNKLKGVDYVAVTSGPGLVTSLILGMATAKTLTFANDLPLVAVNHMEGHVYSNWLSNKELVKDSQKYFPALILVVSGGHTELVLMPGHGQYQLLGQTLDDAVGEAYDKVAKLLGLGYPGGPIVSKLAEQGNKEAYDFPRPMMDKPNYDFSFSGLKTAVLYTLEKKKQVNKQDINDICASFQTAATEVLAKKTIKATQEYNVKSIMVAGGVSANKDLKQVLNKQAKKIDLPFFYPDLKYTGDNAAMIATAAYYNVINKKNNILKNKAIFDLEPRSNWQLSKN
ncbi:MAG: tRNA (adenosine(37)-N6)-threonylcarbamoyltransferase complex transferase subunit TsaD [Candidatus Komeilibacteria bacterium]|jgi:N6-L-threonylcarbamoyladenine synthase|nr:tRNA (adenosine(37)-N6)-threonylcarbamoyltransferase complex transferase subunit TsaD [Candidatus Komeilibacteria bacterium]